MPKGDAKVPNDVSRAIAIAELIFQKMDAKNLDEGFAAMQPKVEDSETGREDSNDSSDLEVLE